MPARWACVEGRSDLDRGLECLIEWQRALCEPVGQRLAFEVLHDEIRRAGLFAHVIQRADVGMIELRDRAGFAVEALAELRIGGERLREDLDRHRAIEPRVARLVDLAHPAGAEGGEDFVRAEAGARLECHGSGCRDYIRDAAPVS